MRKVTGIGETILDIIFQNDQPVGAVPGGSTFNSMISLGRCGLPVYFISEAGNDKVGCLIRNFMAANGLSSDYIVFNAETKSPVSLAFLDKQQNAEYLFYKDFYEKHHHFEFPEINENDVVVFGSYFVLDPAIRDEVRSFLSYARKRKAIIYYDINFRKAHAHERLKIMPSLIENFRFSDIIRCSNEDLDVLFSGESIDTIYADHIAPYCRNFIVTGGTEKIFLKTEKLEKQYDVKAVSSVSTIGAGDGFNAGFVFGIMKYEVLRNNINKLENKDWDKLISLAQVFATEVCTSLENYISKEFAEQIIV